LAEAEHVPALWPSGRLGELDRVLVGLRPPFAQSVLLILVVIALADASVREPTEKRPRPPRTRPALPAERQEPGVAAAARRPRGCSWDDELGRRTRDRGSEAGRGGGKRHWGRAVRLCCAGPGRRGLPCLRRKWIGVGAGSGREMTKQAAKPARRLASLPRSPSLEREALLFIY
jgi:hypothetical protein